MSANKGSETGGRANSRRSKKPPTPGRAPRKAHSGDLGRALRSVYDDTLRESVPDDFLNLIGKLE